MQIQKGNNKTRKMVFEGKFFDFVNDHMVITGLLIFRLNVMKIEAAS